MMALTHLNAQGAAAMVDVGGKPDTRREAVAMGAVRMAPETLALLRAGAVPKGDVWAAARIAGILAAKRVDELIPLCHTVPLEVIRVEFRFGDGGVLIRAMAATVGPTGVEMEALTAVSAAALTIYDMCKAVDRAMMIGPVFLAAKSGGRTGGYQRPPGDLLPEGDGPWL